MQHNHMEPETRRHDELSRLYYFSKVFKKDYKLYLKEAKETVNHFPRKQILQRRPSSEF